jgi:competence protein ComEC
MLLVISSGAVSYSISLNSIVTYPFNTAKIKDAVIYGKISDIELERSYEIRTLVETDSIIAPDKTLRQNYTILCRFRDDKRKKLDSLYNIIKIGNRVKLDGIISKGRGMRNPGEFDYQSYLELKGISGVFVNYDVSKVKILSSEYDSFRMYVFNARRAIDREISALYNQETAGLLKGLILADKSEVSYETQNDFINTGVVHILAVSGSNVALILLMFQILVSRFNVKLKSFLTLLCLLVFLLITGSSPSVVRAAVMGFVVIFSFLSNRSDNIFNSLALAGLIVLIINPPDLFDPGFQLSFSAVLAIVILVPFFQRRIKVWNIKNKITENIILLVLVSLAAQIGTLPFTLYYFGKLSVVSLLANLIVVPLIGLITGIGLFSLIICLFSGWTAQVFALANESLCSFIFWVTHYLGGFKFSYLSIRSFSVLDAVIFYFFITLYFLLYERFNSLIRRIVLTLLVTGNIILLCGLDNKKLMPDNVLSIMAIDVGEGDAILVKYPDNKTALIDAGEANQYFDNGEKVIYPLLNYLGIEMIDYGFISHIDSDHYSGFFSLIEKGIIRKIYKPEVDSSLSKDIRFERYLKKKKIPFCYYNRQVFKSGGTRTYIFNRLCDSKEQSTSNDNSGVMKICYGSKSFLFTGDLGVKGEMYFIESDSSSLASDVLKVSHHGSKSGTSLEFLSVVKPSISIISAGVLNRFKHPAQETLDRLKTVNSKIYRTDEEGAILFRCDGKRIEKIDWRE